jgi:hypothetical protein
MSCRSNAGNSAVTSYARITTGLSDMQTLSTFHALIREGASRNVTNPTRQQVAQWAERGITQIRANENLTPARRTSLINRLEQVRRPDAPLPDGPTFHAWNGLDRVMNDVRITLDREFDHQASRTGLEREEVVRRFETDRAAADTNRNLTVPPDFVEHIRLTNETSDYLAVLGEPEYYPMDRGTLYALHQLREQPSAPVSDTATPSRRRATTTTTTQRRQRQGQPAQVQVNAPTTSAAPVPDQQQAQVPVEREREQSNPLPSALQTQVGRRFQFIDRPASDSGGGVVMRCPDCGEFISAMTAHQCRGRGRADNGDTLTQGISNTTITTNSTGSPSAVAVEIAVADLETPAQTQTQTQAQLLLASEPEPTATPQALERALLATSFGNVTNEQLRTIRYSQFPLLSPPRSSYTQSVFTSANANADADTAPTSTTTTTLTSPTPAAVRRYFSTRGTGYDVNILVGAAQTDLSRSVTNGIQSTRNDYASVEGSVRLHRYMVTNEIGVADTSNLRCSCSNFRREGTCAHITQTVQAIATRYNPPGSEPSPEALQRRRDAAELRLNNYLQEERAASEAAHRAAIAAAEAEAAAEAARQEAEAQAQAQVAEAARVNATATAAVTATGDLRYGQNMAAFQRSYDAAKERKARGEAPIAYLRENATGGLGARDGGRGFGVEIEFDLDHLTEPQKTIALVNIGNELHASGITTTPDQQRYHSTRGDYSQWRYERDRSVSGEIVSPILYDEPQTWERLEKVCEIVRRHGGKATTRTGSHVHVACDNYDHNPRNHNNLLQLFKRNEDVVYRLAQNPEAGNHRGTFYCTPNAVPARDYTSVAAVNSAFTSHRVGLNFGAVTGSNSDHVEFRMWDGTLDPAAIQTQVKLSLAMTEAAFRADAGVFRGNSEPLGTHRQSSTRTRTTTRNQSPAQVQVQVQVQGQGGDTGTGEGRLSGEAWEQDTSSFRNFVDTLFTRAQDKEQLTSLFAVTKWQTS